MKKNMNIQRVEQRSRNYLSCQTPQEGETGKSQGQDEEDSMLGKAEERRGMKRKELQKQSVFCRVKLTFERFFFPEFAFSPMGSHPVLAPKANGTVM